MILGSDETGATAKFQSQTFKVARLRVWKTVEAMDVADAELAPLRERFRHIGADSGSPPRHVVLGADMDVDREDGNDTSSTGNPESESGAKPEMIPVPDSPSPPEQLPSPNAPTGQASAFGVLV